MMLNFRHSAFAVVALSIGMISMLTAGCIGRKDRSSLLTGIATEQVMLKSLHTQAPDVQLTVPKGFEVEWVEEASHDKFYIFDRNDSGATQNGMIVLDITRLPRWIIKDTSEFTRSKGSIGEEDIVWREAAIMTSLDKRVFQREMVSEDVLAPYRSPASDDELLIHAFVVGSDSMLVERLTAAVETITVHPRANL